MMQSQRGQEPLDRVVDRVMAIAQRVVGAENVIKNQSKQIEVLNKEIADLKKKIDNIALKSSGTEFKKPTTTRKISKAKVDPTPVPNSILDEGEEV